MFYTDPCDIDLNAGTLFLRGDEAKHIARSLRAREGERVSVGDGSGNRYETRLTAVEPSVVSGTIISSRYHEKERPSVNVYQAVSKMKHMDETVVRTAESGVCKVVPFISERSPVDSLGKSLNREERWKKIAWESSKLSRRKWLMEIVEVRPDLAGSEKFPGDELTIVLWEGEEEAGIVEILPEKAPESIGLVVGPEGGFSENEIEIFVSRGVKTASMGNLVLRTESAGSYGAILLRSHYGNLGSGGSSI